MSANGFGLLLRVTTWGESHGAAIGCVVDGAPAGLPLSEVDIQPWLDKRRPGQSRFTSQRREADLVRICSGVFEGATTGAPIALEIANSDTRSRDYESLKDLYRPGHADYSWQMKYGHRDWRGGGRASARETAARVAAGAVARRILGANIRIRGALVRMGALPLDESRWDWREVARNPLHCPDPQAVAGWQALLDSVRKEGSSIGAVAEIHVEGVPPGLGEPVYGRLDAVLAAAIMSIPAVKGVEFGSGFAAAAMRGEEHADELRADGDAVRFLSNNNGGILGGVSTGQALVVRYAVKPTSSIRKTLRTVNRSGDETTVSVGGRHDPCVGIRSVPVGEAMVALTLADALLQHRARAGEGAGAPQTP